MKNTVGVPSARAFVRGVLSRFPGFGALSSARQSRAVAVIKSEVFDADRGAMSWDEAERVLNAAGLMRRGSRSTRKSRTSGSVPRVRKSPALRHQHS